MLGQLTYSTIVGVHSQRRVSLTSGA